MLFNRFYQPDIDAAVLEAAPKLHLSDSSELLLRLRWLRACCRPAPRLRRNSEVQTRARVTGSR